MNINEFERNKPRQTRACIEDLLKFTQSMKDENLKNRTYDLRIETLLLKLEKLKTAFLSGN